MEFIVKKSSRRRNAATVYDPLVRQLKDAIQQGKFAPGEQLPPENLLAEQFQISRSSVRMGLGYLENQGVVIRHAGKGTFVQDYNAVEAARKNTMIRTVGINLPMLDSIEDDWYSLKIMKAALSAAQEHDFRLSLTNMAMLGAIGQAPVDAQIILCYDGNPDDVLRLKNAGIEPVLFNRISLHEKLAYVSVNNRNESERAVRFLQQRGHRNIGIIAFNPIASQMENMRISGYLNAMGLSSPEAALSCFVDFPSNAIVYSEIIERFLKRGTVSALYLPHGRFAIPVFRACIRLGLRIPEDLELLCFDDIEYSYATYQLPFHFVRMPLQKMVADTMDYLSEKMTDGKTPVLKKLYQVEILTKNRGDA